MRFLQQQHGGNINFGGRHQHQQRSLVPKFQQHRTATAERFSASANGDASAAATQRPCSSGGIQQRFSDSNWLAAAAFQFHQCVCSINIQRPPLRFLQQRQRSGGIDWQLHTDICSVYVYLHQSGVSVSTAYIVSLSHQLSATAAVLHTYSAVAASCVSASTPALSDQQQRPLGISCSTSAAATSICNMRHGPTKQPPAPATYLCDCDIHNIQAISIGDVSIVTSVTCCQQHLCSISTQQILSDRDCTVFVGSIIQQFQR